MRVRPPPTDLRIVRSIYRRHYGEFARTSTPTGWQAHRATKIYIPIDVEAVADELDVNVEIVYGALHYRLAPRHSVVEKSDQTGKEYRAPLFQKCWPPDIKRTGGFFASERHIIHFPLLASIYAELQEQDSRATWALRWSALGLIISAAAVAFTAATYFGQSRSPTAPMAPPTVPPPPQ